MIGVHNASKQIPLHEYIGNKLMMLKDDFLIDLDEGEIDHMWKLQSEEAVNHYVYQIIINKL